MWTLNPSDSDLSCSYFDICSSLTTLPIISLFSNTCSIIGGPVCILTLDGDLLSMIGSAYLGGDLVIKAEGLVGEYLGGLVPCLISCYILE